MRWAVWAVLAIVLLPAAMAQNISDVATLTQRDLDAIQDIVHGSGAGIESSISAAERTIAQKVDGLPGIIAARDDGAPMARVETTMDQLVTDTNAFKQRFSGLEQRIDTFASSILEDATGKARPVAWFIGILLVFNAFLLIALLVIIVLQLRKGSAANDSTLKSYAANAMRQGASIDEVRRSLQESGWSAEDIAKALKP